MKVREIMTEEIAIAEPDSTLEELAVLMRDGDVGSIPILDDGELVGIVTDRDIVVGCVAEGHDPSEMTAEELMSEDLETVEPDANCNDAALIMARRQVRRLPVVEEGVFIGMISLGDIAVKEESNTAGEALEDISQGTKSQRGGADRRKPSTKVSSQRGATQDISNRNRREEEQRQSKVTSQSRHGKPTHRRKAG